MRIPTRWALEWKSKTRLEGEKQWIMWSNCFPLLFLTRRDARKYANEKHGYIKTRKDLRNEPHGWRFPKAVRVSVSIKKTTMNR